MHQTCYSKLSSFIYMIGSKLFCWPLELHSKFLTQSFPEVASFSLVHIFRTSLFGMVAFWMPLVNMRVIFSFFKSFQLLNSKTQPNAGGCSDLPGHVLNWTAHHQMKTNPSNSGDNKQPQSTIWKDDHSSETSDTTCCGGCSAAVDLDTGGGRKRNTATDSFFFFFF